MAHTHLHSHHLPAPLSQLAARIVVTALSVIGLAVIIGAVLLWPSNRKVDIPLPFQSSEGGAVTTEAGHVLSASMADCGSRSAGQVLTAAPRPGYPATAAASRRSSASTADPTRAPTPCSSSPRPRTAEPVGRREHRIFRQVDQQGATSYGFYDYERTWPLILLAAAFAVVIVAVARWRGLRALIGIVVAFVVLVMFLLPTLRDGAPALPVTLVASAAILFAVLYLAHGVSLRTSAALLGTLTAMLLSAGCPGVQSNSLT